MTRRATTFLGGLAVIAFGLLPDGAKAQSVIDLEPITEQAQRLVTRSVELLVAERNAVGLERSPELVASSPSTDFVAPSLLDAVVEPLGDFDLLGSGLRPSFHFTQLRIELNGKF